MKELITLELTAAGLAQLDCPVGHRIRLMLASTQFGVAADGEIVTVQFLRGAVRLASACSNALPASISDITFGIGLTNSAPIITAIGAAAGPVTYTSGSGFGTAALPDIWFPFSVNIAITATAFATGILTYEREKLLTSFSRKLKMPASR